MQNVPPEAVSFFFGKKELSLSCLVSMTDFTCTHNHALVVEWSMCGSFKREAGRCTIWSNMFFLSRELLLTLCWYLPWIVMIVHSSGKSYDLTVIMFRSIQFLAYYFSGCFNTSWVSPRILMVPCNWSHGIFCLVPALCMHYCWENLAPIAHLRSMLCIFGSHRPSEEDVMYTGISYTTLVTIRQLNFPTAEAVNAHVLSNCVGVIICCLTVAIKWLSLCRLAVPVYCTLEDLDCTGL